MRVALAQLNTTVGDLEGNTRRIVAAVRCASGVDLVVFPELTLTGYPPLDLLDDPVFVVAAERAAEALAEQLKGGPAALVGSVRRGANGGRPARNVVLLMVGGAITAVAQKTLLPTYDVFDEDRWFEPAAGPSVVVVGGRRVGVTICEDLWTSDGQAETLRHVRRPIDALGSVAPGEVDLIVNLSASPYAVGKPERRLAVMQAAARRIQRPLVHVNLVGGNDDLIFDGGSVALSADGAVLVEAGRFVEDLVIVDLDVARPRSPAARDEAQDVLDALVLGVADYTRKVGVRRAVIGLSGGIDSAVTAAIAVRALGRENVVGIAMPSEFSSQHSLDDAQALATNLSIDCHIVAIQPSLDALRASLGGVLGGGPWGLADENLQARIRGQILMAFSNRHGHLVLSTGNKSEIAVGYCTLYGDMCGALSVIGDVWKTDVYRLAHTLNRGGPCIPASTIDKPPSAELRPDQRDDQSLPPYEVLDPILEALVVERRSPGAVGGDPAVIARIGQLVQGSEYKRRQGAIVLRVSEKAFGSGRRLPIAQGFRRHAVSP